MKSIKGAKATGMLLAAFVTACILVLVTSSFIHLIVLALAFVLALAVVFALRVEVRDIVRQVNYSNMGVGVVDRKPVVTLVSGIVLGAEMLALAIAISWNYSWMASLSVVIFYVLSIMILMVWAYVRLHVDGLEPPMPSYRLSSPIQVSSLQEDELLPEVPKPVYGIVNVSQKTTSISDQAQSQVVSRPEDFFVVEQDS